MNPSNRRLNRHHQRPTSTPICKNEPNVGRAPWAVLSPPSASPWRTPTHGQVQGQLAVVLGPNVKNRSSLHSVASPRARVTRAIAPSPNKPILYEPALSAIVIAFCMPRHFGASPAKPKYLSFLTTISARDSLMPLRSPKLRHQLPDHLASMSLSPRPSPSDTTAVMVLVGMPAKTHSLRLLTTASIMRCGEPTSPWCRSTYVAKPLMASAIIRGAVCSRNTRR